MGLSGTSPFSASKLSNHPQPSSLQPEGGIFSPQTAASKSPSSSCSQSSSSSHSFSSGTQQHAPTWNVSSCEDPIVGENFGDGVLKTISSEAELHASSQGPKLLPSSAEKDRVRVSQEGDAQRFKLTYGNEKIRFRMQNNWGYKDLLLGIASQFNIDDMSRFVLEYLDEESDWILLRSDDDLEECLDIWRSSQSHIIKLSLQVSRFHRGRS